MKNQDKKPTNVISDKEFNESLEEELTLIQFKKFLWEKSAAFENALLESILLRNLLYRVSQTNKNINMNSLREVAIEQRLKYSGYHQSNILLFELVREIPVSSIEELIGKKVYVSIYQSFEYYLWEIFFEIFYNYPKFLYYKAEKDEDKNVHLNYIDLFDQKAKLKELKKTIISKKLKTILDSNIKRSFENIEKKLSIKIGITDDEFDRILQASRKRNVIVHNNNIVDKLYFELISKTNLGKKKIKIGDKLIKEWDSEITELVNICININAKLHNCLKLKIKDIRKKHIHI